MVGRRDGKEAEVCERNCVFLGLIFYAHGNRDPKEQGSHNGLVEVKVALSLIHI